MSGNDQQVLSGTESVCPRCLARVPAVRVARGNNIYLRKTCPEHGDFESLLWRGEPDFSSWVRPKIPSQPKVAFTEVTAAGCPFDCGLCAGHRQHTCTALLEVTQRCNLHCTFCFASAGTNQSNDPDQETIAGWYQRLLAAGGPFNIQLSGGEPTMRDDLPEIVALGRSLGFNFIQLNTNGLRLAREAGYAKRLKEAGLASVFLQFDGTRDDIYQKLRGGAYFKEKLTAIERCGEQGIGVVLVPTLVPAVNVDNIGAMINLALQYMPAVRGIHFQPVSYFGRYPEPPRDADRITLPEVIMEMEKQTEGLIKRDSFKPPGCENALCSFHGNFVLQPDGELKPLTKNTQSTCCGRPEKAEEGARKARSFVAQHWTVPKLAPGVGASDSAVAAFDAFLDRVLTHSFSISAMAFQDVWNIDLERLKDCCIHVMAPNGKLIPFCAYNLTGQSGRSLYRNGSLL